MQKRFFAYRRKSKQTRAKRTRRQAVRRSRQDENESRKENRNQKHARTRDTRAGDRQRVQLPCLQAERPAALHDQRQQPQEGHDR